MTAFNDIPISTDISIILFGKGIGECVLVNIGDNRYVVIDSFINKNSGKPIALDYLESINVPFCNIELIICTHWHQDHTEGIAEVIKNAPEAKFYISYINKEKNFLTYLTLGSNIENSTTHDLFEALNIVNRSNLYFARHNQVLLEYPDTEFSHGKKIQLRAISPQQIEELDFIEHLSLPNSSENTYTFTSDNKISIATWLTIGEDAVLFGADLENVADSSKGWKAVINNHTFTNTKASIFKIPHHGSKNGHNNDIWTNLVDKPISITSTYSRSHLPLETDIDRIKGLSKKFFVAGKSYYNKKQKQDLAKFIKKTKIDIDYIPTNLEHGMIILTFKEPENKWIIVKNSNVTEFTTER